MQPTPATKKLPPQGGSKQFVPGRGEKVLGGEGFDQEVDHVILFSQPGPGRRLEGVTEPDDPDPVQADENLAHPDVPAFHHRFKTGNVMELPV